MIGGRGGEVKVWFVSNMGLRYGGWVGGEGCKVVDTELIKIAETDDHELSPYVWPVLAVN